MNIYLLDNAEHCLDGGLESALKQAGSNVEHVSLPSSHEDIVPLMEAKGAGIVFLPPMWVDLFSVKAVQEIQSLSVPFETVIYGPEPSPTELIVAFNEGLSAYLRTPLDDDELKRVLSRTTARYKEKLQQDQEAKLSENNGSQPPPESSYQQRVVRDRLLARALVDSRHRQGPMFEDTVSVLLVSSSNAQQRQLEAYLKKADIAVKSVGNTEEAAEAAQTARFDAIVSDSVLPDGDAATLINRMRNCLTSEIPRFIVWTSSPEKATELEEPENHIDEVVLKPSPDAGMDSILLSVIMGVYHTKAG